MVGGTQWWTGLSLVEPMLKVGGDVHSSGYSSLHYSVTFPPSPFDRPLEGEKNPVQKSLKKISSFWKLTKNVSKCSRAIPMGLRRTILALPEKCGCFECRNKSSGHRK